MLGELAEINVEQRVLRQLLEAREQEQVLHQDTHPGGLRLDSAHRPFELGAVTGGAEAKQLRVAADRGERGAQLMRRIG